MTKSIVICYDGQNCNIGTEQWPLVIPGFVHKCTSLVITYIANHEFTQGQVRDNHSKNESSSQRMSD